MSQPEEAPGPKHRKTFRDALPETLGKFYDSMGLSAIIVFAVGFVSASALALTIFYSGKIPSGLIPDDYKKLSGPSNPTAEDGQRSKPKNIETHLLTETPDWANPIKNWLQAEGSKRKNERLITDFATDVIETGELTPTPEFKWVLKASSADYTIVGWAFKLSRTNSLPQLVPLERKKSSDGRDTMIFEVPKCEKGDRLIAIVRLSWERPITPIDFLSSFRSSVE